MWWCQAERPKSTSSSDGGSWEELDLVSLEAELFLLGHWKNFEEIEENLTLKEVEVILKAARDQEYHRQKFAAALKGVNLDENKTSSDEEEPTFEDIKRRAQARLTGISEEQLEFADIGIAIVEED